MNTCVQGVKLGAAKRLLESMPIKMGENYTQPEFELDVGLLEKRLKTKTPISLGTKDGLSLYCLKLPSSRDFFLKDNDKIIGILATTAKSSEVINVFVSQEYR